MFWLSTSATFRHDQRRVSSIVVRHQMRYLFVDDGRRRYQLTSTSTQGCAPTTSLRAETGDLVLSMYGFSTQAVGIAYVVSKVGERSRRSFSGRYMAFAVGSVLGKTARGWVGDCTVLWIQARTGKRHSECRIWAMVGAVNDLNRCLMLIMSQIPPHTADSARRIPRVRTCTATRAPLDGHARRRRAGLHGRLCQL
jgi:hypothetical protein